MQPTVITNNATSYIVAITRNASKPPKFSAIWWLDKAMVPNGKVIAQYVLLNAIKPVNILVKGFWLNGL